MDTTQLLIIVISICYSGFGFIVSDIVYNKHPVPAVEGLVRFIAFAIWPFAGIVSMLTPKDKK